MRPDVAKMVDRFYAPLMKQLNLAPEQKEKLYQVLLDHRMNGVAQRADLLRHEDPARLARIALEIQKETDAKLLALLGDANFVEYQQYEATIPDRATLEMFKGDFAGCPLSEEQHQRLIGAMVAARKAVVPVPGDIEGFSINDNSEVMERKLERQKSIHERVLRDAVGFLSPAQLQALETAFARKIHFTKNGWKQAQEMFGGRR